MSMRCFWDILYPQVINNLTVNNLIILLITHKKIRRYFFEFFQLYDIVVFILYRLPSRDISPYVFSRALWMITILICCNAFRWLYQR